MSKKKDVEKASNTANFCTDHVWLQKRTDTYWPINESARLHSVQKIREKKYKMLEYPKIFVFPHPFILY